MLAAQSYNINPRRPPSPPPSTPPTTPIPTSTSPSPPTLRRPQTVPLLPPALPRARPAAHSRRLHQRQRPRPLARRRPHAVHLRQQRQNPRRHRRRHQPPHLHPASTQPIRIPMDPFPIKRTPVDKKITQDDNDFGFQGTVVNAHSTLAGYLFYDIKGLDDPALQPRRALRQDGPHARRQAGTLRLLHPLRQVARRQSRRSLQPPAKVIVSCRLSVAGC